MKILKMILGSEKNMEKEQEPEFKQDKKYRLCIEDNPNKTKCGYCGKNNVVSPDCKLSLYLEEITHEEVCDIEMKIRIMLAQHNFTMR